MEATNTPGFSRLTDAEMAGIVAPGDWDPMLTIVTNGYGTILVLDGAERPVAGFIDRTDDVSSGRIAELIAQAVRTELTE